MGTTFKRTIALFMFIIQIGCTYGSIHNYDDSIVRYDYMGFFLNNDSFFSQKNIFIGEYHPFHKINVLILRDILARALKSQDTVILLLEMGPTEARLINSYLTLYDDSLIWDINELDKSTARTNRGWTWSMVNMLNQDFGHEIKSGRIVIKGMDMEEMSNLSLACIYSICYKLITNPNIVASLKKINESHRYYLKDYFRMFADIEKEFTDSTLYDKINPSDREFLREEFKAVRVYANYFNKKKQDDSDNERETGLITYYEQVLSNHKSKQIITYLGIWHIHRIPDLYYPQGTSPIVSRLLKDNIIPNAASIGLVKQKAIKKMWKDYSIDDSLWYSIIQKVRSNTIYHIINKVRYLDYAILF